MSTPSQHDSQAVSRGRDLFVSTFSEQPTIAVASPGRVNLIGEHTDYNDGFVFPLALEKSTYLIARPLPSGSPCQIASEAKEGEIITFAPGDNSFDGIPEWVRYIKGMTAIYERHGYPIGSFQAVVVSDVPFGSGLSSSAALEVATGLLIEQISGASVDPSKRALMGQECENKFLHVPCGIMDQMISSCGKEGHALLIDCRSYDLTPVPLNDPETLIVVANSCVKHKLSGSEYPLRTRQCKDAAKVIAAKFPDQKVLELRDATMDMLNAVAEELDQDTLKRARHAISEDDRTLEAKSALENGDLVKAGKLMHESHVSLRDDFEVSTSEIDALVEIAMTVDGVYGSRITGGGFGGCTVTLVRKSALQTLLDEIEAKYPQKNNGTKAIVFATQAGSGARVLTPLLN